jgi:hypothetical protein
MKTSWLTIVLLLVFTVVRVQGQGSQSGTPAIAGQGTVPAQAVRTGTAAGVDLPPADEVPEFFGFDLPPDNP